MRSIVSNEVGGDVRNRIVQLWVSGLRVPGVSGLILTAQILYKEPLTSDPMAFAASGYERCNRLRRIVES